jgi:hypothetical protein
MLLSLSSAVQALVIKCTSCGMITSPAFSLLVAASSLDVQSVYVYMYNDFIFLHNLKVVKLHFAYPVFV